MRDYEQPPFAIEVEQRAGRTILNLSGELDIATVGELEDALKQRLDAGEDLVVDLRTLQFMDSSGVRALVAGHAAAQNGHGSLVIVRAQRDGGGAGVPHVWGSAGAGGRVEEPQGGGRTPPTPGPRRPGGSSRGRGRATTAGGGGGRGKSRGGCRTPAV